MIHYLSHYQIDKEKWDECIGNSPNRLVYGFAWFLDIVSPGWEALVEDDYRSVMPLPSKQKYGLHYLIQPRFTQQLGIFSPQPVTRETVRSFLRRIPKKFVWCNINLNQANCEETIFKFTLRTNYELDLQAGYENIVKRYNENTRRNLKKAASSGINVELSDDTAFFVELYQQQSNVKHEGIAIEQFYQLIQKSFDKGIGRIALAKNVRNEIVAGAFYLEDRERLIYLASFTTSWGQDASAMFLIMDRMIEGSLSQFNIFDFEGSMVPGIARFFKGFGAIQRDYPQFSYKLVNPLLFV
ncbi:MAG: peptidoglycan bridge formation glycyltransferase FemA/FemB family protein [Bacteroidota bacterium]|nr:peptidoglycan bridge formation glycyltransferase FemA/FemB family protein [Bacteroidota bacterium]